jgi:FKBP-type peptidyl-prolyl cis-trans isomerase (trigger factor)
MTETKKGAGKGLSSGSEANGGETLRSVTNLEIKKLGNSEIEIKAQIPEEIVSKYKNQAIKKLGKNIKIDGFRSGHIPESVLLGKIGAQAILEEQAQMALSSVYLDIIKSEKLAVIGLPEVLITKLAPNNPIEFKIKTALMPEFELPDYKKIASKIEIAKDKDTDEIKAKENRRAEIVESIIKETKIDIPKILIESELDKMLALFKDDIAKMNIKFKEYLEKIKKTEESLRTEWKLDAEKRAKFQLILNKIASEEEVKVPEEDIEKEVKHILEHYKDAKPENVRVYIESVLTNEKVFQLLEEQK